MSRILTAVDGPGRDRIACNSLGETLTSVKATIGTEGERPSFPGVDPAELERAEKILLVATAGGAPQEDLLRLSDRLADWLTRGLQ